MRLLIINRSGQSVLQESSFIPRIGDKVELFYEPLPTVKGILCWPSLERLKELDVQDRIDAIITVD